MLKLSFILPCYNVAPYVGRCIESIEHQDIPQSEYEVICVDDCSSDNTVEVIQDYQQHYPNIRLICHEVNKTAGGARNSGMDAASGEYLWFVDPDDAIETNIVSRLYVISNREDVDILIFNYIMGRSEGREYKGNTITCSKKVLTGQEFFIQCYPTQRMASNASVWNNLYRRSFCMEKCIRYPEIKSSQDVVFAWTAFLKAQRVYSIDEGAYVVYGHAESTTGSIGRYKAINVISAPLLYVSKLMELNANVEMEQVYHDDLLFVCRESMNNDSRKVLSMVCKEQHIFYNEMQKYKDLILQFQPLMNRKTKIIFNYRLPYILWQLIIWGYALNYTWNRYFKRTKSDIRRMQCAVVCI